jgi:hypothetical protein
MIPSQMVKSANHFVVDFVTDGRRPQHARANPRGGHFMTCLILILYLPFQDIDVIYFAYPIWKV